MLDMARAREVFEASQDFTVGIEEEFAILDPETRALTPRFEELRDAAQQDEVLKKSVAGELIRSEIEIRSQKIGDFGTALADQRENRGRLFTLAASQNVLLGATWTHPWSRWQDQEIIHTEHYQQLRENLGYVAYRNNTFSIHLHVDSADAWIERAVAAGAVVLRPAADAFYGERSGSVRDPFGHEWLLGHQVEEVSTQEMQRRYTALFEG